MFSWIKNNAIMVLVSALATMVAAVAFLFVMWRGAEHDAQEAKALAHTQTQIIAAQTRISEHEDRVDRVTVDVVQRALETPNATQIVPPDVADAWFSGIDSVRHSATAANERHDDVSGPDGDHAGKDRPKSRRSDSHVYSARERLPKM